MKTKKQIKREARHLLRICHENGSLNEDRVRLVIHSVLSSRRRGFLALANQFEHLVKLDRRDHSAKVESASLLPPDLQEKLRASLTQKYGAEVSASFIESPELIGGMRVQVGSDVFDGSIKGALTALERSF